MPAANVTLVIDQGEDYTAQIIWTDGRGTPHPVTLPIRLDIMDATMPVLSLTTPDEDWPEGTIPEITYSSELGLIQIHIPRGQTSAVPPGMYTYDMFASVDDGGVYAGVQQQRIMAGSVFVNKRMTVM